MSPRGKILFSELQRFRQWYTRVVLAFPPAALIFITCRQILWHRPWGKPPTSDGGLIFLSVLLAAVYFRLVTIKLMTELRSEGLLVGLHGLWRRRRIPLADIRSAREVTYDAAMDFGGYGIRSGRRGTAYIARGNRAVELTLSNGGRLVIGSQHAAELARKITEIHTQSAP